METELSGLPEDILAGVLRRLPARSLATAARVCKAWHTIVDTGGMLLPYRTLLPCSVRGIFINYMDRSRPRFFARPSSSSTTPKFDAALGFMPNDIWDRWSVLDHCNGLLLREYEWESGLCVCNPATRRWEVLPRHDEERLYYYVGAYLAFDPAVSSHFEVILIPDVPSDRHKVDEERRRSLLRQQEIDAPFCLDWFFTSPSGAVIGDGTDEVIIQQPVESSPSVNKLDHEPDCDPCWLMEWPPSPWRLNVYSSRTGRWENRAFVREGEPAGTVEDMRLDPSQPTYGGPRRRYAVYHQGDLYVYCPGSFVTRLSLSNCAYQVIKVPVNNTDAKPYLGRSKKGVCFGIVHECQLRVWILSESCGQMEWVLTYQDELSHYARHMHAASLHGGPWILEEDNIDRYDTADNVDTLPKESSEWDSDNDDIFTINKVDDVEYHCGEFQIVGFHPYKEVVFLDQWFGIVAYHWNSSKFQYLGSSRPKGHYSPNGMYESFLYTPCMIGDPLHGGNPGQSSSED